MSATIKRLIAAFVATGMALAIIPALPAWAEEDLPAWAQDPEYHEVLLLTTQEEMPASFDLRDRGVVTPVRLQSPYSTCWAFSALAAAETSIISDLGAPTTLDLSEKHLIWFGMHTVRECDDPNQAGEGITVFAEGTAGGNAVYIASNPVIVSTLFSTGIGPVYENDTDGVEGFPYRGKSGITKLDSISSDEYIPRWKENRLKELINIYGSEEKVLSTILEYTSYKSIDEYLDSEIATALKDIDPNCYSDLDDWSIPFTSDEGESNRNLFAGYTLRDGNVLPSTRKLDQDGNWAGLNELGMQAIKQELMAGHGVSIPFCADTSSPNQQASTKYINANTWAHYTYETAKMNHAVCLVGWDDNYPASNFTHTLKDKDDATAAELTTPPGDGAWIVKNSWGCSDGVGTAVNDVSQVLGKSSWGIDGSGYFYISYYDHSLGTPESLKFDNDLDVDEFYSHVYDYLPATDGFYELTAEKPLSSANVFTADENEQVVSVSTRSTEPNERVTVALYLLNDNAADPTDGTLVETCSYDVAYTGFHRFNLSEPFKVKKGQRFSVVSTVSRIADDGRRMYDVCASSGMTEARARSVNDVYYSTAVVHEGESYLYEKGVWKDWAEYQKSDYFISSSAGKVVDNFSIKAYALPWEPASYACAAGDGASWTQGSTEGLTFVFEETTVHGRPAFARAVVDDVEIDPSVCAVSDSDMVMTLNADYLAGLSVGTHAIVVYFEDGDPVTATFTVIAAEPPSDDEGQQVVLPNPGTNSDATPANSPGGSVGNNTAARYSARSNSPKSSQKVTSRAVLPRTSDASHPALATGAFGAGIVVLSVGVFLQRRREDSC